ncbi:MAG: exo-beta-N-acetylmuramidase NamZ domain-containing protein [Candidatus Babeliales bacterium]
MLHSIYLFLLLCSSFSLFAQYKLGLENISNELITSLKGKRIGLVTNQTGKDQQGNRNIDLLLNKGLNITHLFAPEHGIEGMVERGKTVHDAKDAKTGLPIVSVYSQGGDHTTQGKQVDTALLDAIDVFIFDMQDAGMRHYTYVSTMYKLLEVASQFGKPVIILDRPNPLGGVMEAPLVEPALKSFIGIAPIPVRHGMTFGELATFFNKYYFQDTVLLTVVKMADYRRDMIFTTLLAPLSPKITTLKSLRGYSFLGLIGEVWPLNVDGATEEFTVIGIPKKLKFDVKKFDALRTVLKDLHIVSCWHTYYSKRRQDYFVGLDLKIEDPNKVSTIHALLAVLEFFKKEGVQLSFGNFDRAMGSPIIREYIEGKIDKKRLVQALKRDTQAFYIKAKPFILYEPAPHWLL